VKNFTFERPSSLEELLRLKHEHREKALLMAGSTNLLVYIKDGVYTEGTLIDVKSLGALKGIAEADGCIEIGPSEIIDSIRNSSIVAKHLPLLAESLNLFANPVVREMSTIGGNIADASPIADTAPVLLALHAELLVASSSGERTVPLDEFFIGPGKTVLKPDEVILKLMVPKQAPGAGKFMKLGLRKGTSCSVTSAALWIVMDGTKVRDIRIGLGGVAPIPIRARKTEEAFKGKSIDTDSLDQLCGTVKADIEPITDVRASARYRREVSGNLVKKAVRCSIGMED
jgi:carbon-monoxide dehydrogenase medium subunit